MHEKVKFKEHSGFMFECLLSFNPYNSGNFHPNEKNKTSKSKLGSPLSNTKKDFKNQTKCFCSIVDQMQDFFGTPGISNFIFCFKENSTPPRSTKLKYEVQSAV